MPSFVAIDVETANPDLASICQIGVARFEDGEVVEEWSSLINPEDYFCPSCIRIHGIAEEDVVGQPKITDIYEEISERISGNVLVAHTSFDKTSITRAFIKSGIEMPEWRWLDSSRVARRAWPEVARRGYGLANLASRLGIVFTHHDALQDAVTAGRVLVHAIRSSEQDLEWWMRRVNRRIDVRKGSDLSEAPTEANPEGLLFGEAVVFTGALSMPRIIATREAINAGCEVVNSVTKRITLLVVGDQDITKLAGHEKSSKHRRAEELIGQGVNIRILGESDFMRMIEGGFEESE